MKLSQITNKNVVYLRIALLEIKLHYLKQL